MIRVGIIGGAGYTAGELLRLLVNHPEVQIAYVHSNSNAGNPIAQVHNDLLGEIDLTFSATYHFDIDCLFLCMGHGKSQAFLTENELPVELKLIDLSRDFRLKAPDHAFVYGLPELNRTAIQSSNRIANCGCFATCIQLGLLPLAYHRAMVNPVHINATTGSTGAGQKPMATTHFSWRSHNLSVYKAFNHQHLGEIRQSLIQLMPGFKQKLHFIPMRGPFPRGIFASMYLSLDVPIEQVQSWYNSYYEAHPFVHISPVNPNLKQVINTNKCLIYLTKHEDQLLIISMIDNLVKGASGQAIQNMNIRFGLEETTGLKLKALAF